MSSTCSTDVLTPQISKEQRRQQYAAQVRNVHAPPTAHSNSQVLVVHDDGDPVSPVGLGVITEPSRMHAQPPSAIPAKSAVYQDPMVLVPSPHTGSDGVLRPKAVSGLAVLTNADGDQDDVDMDIPERPKSRKAQPGWVSDLMSPPKVSPRSSPRPKSSFGSYSPKLPVLKELPYEDQPFSSSQSVQELQDLLEDVGPLFVNNGDVADELGRSLGITPGTLDEARVKLSPKKEGQPL